MQTIYALVDATTKEVDYVGMTGLPLRKRYSFQQLALGGLKAVTLATPATRAEARGAEREWIARLNPRRNVLSRHTLLIRSEYATRSFPWGSTE